MRLTRGLPIQYRHTMSKSHETVRSFANVFLVGRAYALSLMVHPNPGPLSYQFLTFKCVLGIIVKICINITIKETN